MNTMKQWMKVVMAAGLMVLGLGVVQRADAYKNPDSMTVWVTPIGLNYSVSIDSTTNAARVGYDFGQVTVGQTTVSTRPIVVSNDGTVGEYFSLAVSNTSPDNWAAQNLLANATNDKFFLLGHFVAHGNPQPDETTGFSVTVDTVVASGVSYGNGNFGQNAITIPTPGSNAKDLYMKLKMPDTVSLGREQSMTLTINAQSN